MNLELTVALKDSLESNRPSIDHFPANLKSSDPIKRFSRDTALRALHIQLLLGLQEHRMLIDEE